jgi:hypothetical protein
VRVVNLGHSREAKCTADSEASLKPIRSALSVWQPLLQHNLLLYVRSTHVSVSLARQRLGKHVPAAKNTRDNRKIVGRVIFYAIRFLSKVSLCVCESPPINFGMPEANFMKLCMYIMAPEPILMNQTKLRGFWSACELCRSSDRRFLAK